MFEIGTLVMIDESLERDARAGIAGDEPDYSQPHMLADTDGDRAILVTGHIISYVALLPYVSLHDANRAVLPFAKVYLDRLGAAWEKFVALHRRDHPEQEWLWRQQELFIVRFLTLRLCQRAYMREAAVDWQAVIGFEINSLYKRLEGKLK